MPMFRFWTAESRGGEKPVENDCHVLSDWRIKQPSAVNIVAIPGLPTPVSPPAEARPLGRRRPSLVDTSAGDYFGGHARSAKRIKTEPIGGLPSPTTVSADGDHVAMVLPPVASSRDLDCAKEVIESQFSLEILLKHDELRLINQELAKCQIALEQLRRCHLIPYPVDCPTPRQMLDISSGKGPALQSAPGEPVPKWAPPFGVVEGPYARHYAKWLIPDPMFDGLQPEPRGPLDALKTKGAIVPEGRTTRNSSVGEAATTLAKPRSGRGSVGSRLHALSSGYSQPKDKHSPCTLKRSDGVTVKLICIDCHRWDFSSTQGFINHCRIAHRRDFKSHEEAAIHCGHPIETGEGKGVVGDEAKPAPLPLPSPDQVHPLACKEALSDLHVYKNITSRIDAALALYAAGGIPHVQEALGLAPRATGASKPVVKSEAAFVGSAETPHLSQLMRTRRIGADLEKEVDEAKMKMDLDFLSADDESDEAEQSTGLPQPSTNARVPVMRVPARAAPASPPPASVTGACPESRRCRAPPPPAGLTAEADACARQEVETPMYEDLMDVDLSPNTVSSNSAPSLVSDDGEYDDDSEGGSESDPSEALEDQPMSDVAEINGDDDTAMIESVKPRPPPSKKEGKHVTFVQTLPTNKAKRRRQA